MRVIMSLRQDVGEICTQIREEKKNSTINKFRNSLSPLDHSFWWESERESESLTERERKRMPRTPESHRPAVTQVPAGWSADDQHQAPREQGVKSLQCPQLPESGHNTPAEVSWGFPLHSNRLWLLREHPIVSSQLADLWTVLRHGQTCHRA